MGGGASRLGGRPCRACNTALGLPQAIEKSPGRREIGRIEPFGEPIVDRLQDRYRVDPAALLAQQSGETGRGTQLPGKSALLVRLLQGLSKTRFHARSFVCAPKP